MVKTKIKRAVSFVMATVLSLSAFMSIGTSTAFAASGEKTKVYMVDFPRDGDANYDGVWGHSNLTLKNGWHTGSSTHTNLKAIGSYSGNIAYCIEPGVSLSSGQSMNKYDENYFNNITANGVISGDEIRLFIGRILQYGYRGTISTSWRSQNESAANSIAHAYATQLLIWETVVGERDANFNHKAASGCSNVKDVINAKHPLRSKIMNYYNSMVSSVQNHTVVPSFCTKSSGSAKVNELEWNGSKYVATLTDSNGVLSNYDFKANISGVTFSTSGNKLTVSMDKAPSKEFTITASKKNGVRRGVVVWSEGKHGQNSSVQDVVTYAQEVSDPVSGYVKMKVSYGSCQIVKTSEDGKVDGINFTISGNGVNQTVTTANGGKFQIDNLMPGVYTVTEQSIDKYVPQEVHRDFDVFISQDGQTYRYLINNANFESYIKVVKVDAETGKTIPYAGAGFQIYDPDGNKVSMTFTYPTPTTIDTFYTDADGQLVTPEKLDYGKGYSLVEVQAPYGYVLDSTPVSFDVTEENSTQEAGITLIKVDKPNMAQKGTISVEKTGEVFFGVNVSGEEDEDEDVIYQPVYKVKGLAGAVYEITADEDIITPDGTLRYHKGDVVDTVTTDEDGTAKSKELYLGKYTVVETKAPNGMVINKEKHSVELTYAGQDVAVTETATSFVNERQKVKISLEKVLEQNETFGIGKNDEIKNISFGLYAKEDIVSSSGTVIPADGLIEIITLDEKGTATANTDLPFGSYYIKEIATDEHYILSDTQYPFTFEYAGQDTETVEIKVNDGKPIENKLIYGSVSGKKIDENGEALGGALIGIFKADETEFTKEHAIMTATSEKDGRFSFAKVPYGKWIIREIEAPEGFVLDDTSYEVNIGENEQVIKVEITDEYIHGNIELTKVDADYPDNKLTGATFDVYKDVNGDGKLDDGDELIGNLEETATGIYEMKELLYGKYLVRETKAPEGFVLDKGVYSVFIEKDETTYKVENKAGVGFINEAMKGNLKIKKTSSDGKVEGFTFRVTGVNGYDSTFTTDKNQVFEMAVDDDYIRSNPTDNVLRELKKSHCFKTEKRRALTKPEQELFLNYLKNTPEAQYWKSDKGRN